jgi:hypothetical protein
MNRLTLGAGLGRIPSPHSGRQSYDPNSGGTTQLAILLFRRTCQTQLLLDLVQSLLELRLGPLVALANPPGGIVVDGIEIILACLLQQCMLFRCEWSCAH